RNEVIVEAALDYIQLDILDASMSVQTEQQTAVAKLEDIVSQRVQAGLDSQVDLTRARLAVARTRLDIAQTQAAADELRLRLSRAPAPPPGRTRTPPKPPPPLPRVSQDDDLSGQAAGNNPVLKAAEASARAKEFRAQAERKALLPTVDLAGQYAVLAKFNNY